MLTLPGLCVQIRNLQHLAKDLIWLSSQCKAENFPNSLWGWVIASLAKADFQYILAKLQAKV
jgi:hypothetical protein